MPIWHWTKELSTEDSNEIYRELALRHINRISDETVRNCLASHASDGDFLALCDFDIPYATLSVYDALNVRQALGFFQKRGDLDVGIDRRRAAIEKFIEAEALCQETNDIFRKRSQGLYRFSPRVESILHVAQRKITSILGELPELSQLKLRFGPGATTQVKKKNASAKRKLSSPFCCNEDAFHRIADVISEMPAWAFPDGDVPVDGTRKEKRVPVEVHPGRLGFVPKSYKIERTTVTEPSLPMMVQLGIGDHMSSRLRLSGIDLRDQTANQKAAREGSISGDLATLDLSSASDTIASGLVLDLLPYDWFDFLSSFRTSLVDCEGVGVRLQKFSSMGNGFTFALESIIFYALSWASTNAADRDKVLVYGDDIIVPTHAYEPLCEVLHAVGFVPNKAKSFSTGPFRESCGGDYLRGFDIRPFYAKGPVSARLLFLLHNFYVRAGEAELAETILPLIPAHLQRWGPDGYGDGHLVGRGALRPHKRERGWAGYTFQTYTVDPKKDFEVLPGDRVYPFYTIYAGVTPDIVDKNWSPSYLSLESKDVLYGRPGHSYDKKGRIGVTTPGGEAYKLISIYTLCPA